MNRLIITMLLIVFIMSCSPSYNYIYDTSTTTTTTTTTIDPRGYGGEWKINEVGNYRKIIITIDDNNDFLGSYSSVITPIEDSYETLLEGKHGHYDATPTEISFHCSSSYNTVTQEWEPVDPYEDNTYTYLVVDDTLILGPETWAKLP